MVTIGIIVGAFLSLVVGMAIGQTRSLIIGLAPEEAVLELADQIDTSKEEMQSLIDEQNTKLEEQNKIIQEQQGKIDEQAQSISNISQNISQVQATATETQMALTSQIDCVKKYEKYSYCERDEYRKKSAFDKMVKDNKKGQSKEAHESDKKELKERFEICQTFINECPL